MLTIISPHWTLSTGLTFPWGLSQTLFFWHVILAFLLENHHLILLFTAVLMFSPQIVMKVVSFAARLLHVCGFCIVFVFVVVCWAVQTHPPGSQSLFQSDLEILQHCSWDSYTGETKLFPAKTAHGNKGPVGEHKLGQHMWKIWLVQCHLVFLYWTRASWGLALYKHSKDLALRVLILC